MGLDSYLRWDKYVPISTDVMPRAIVDGFPVCSQVLELGYWRKNWDLHNYITENFEDGDFFRVPLTGAQLRRTADKFAWDIKTALTLNKAADWLYLPSSCWKSVEYYASW